MYVCTVSDCFLAAGIPVAKSNKSLLLEDDSIIYAQSLPLSESALEGVRSGDVLSNDQKREGVSVSEEEPESGAGPDLPESSSSSSAERKITLITESLNSLSLAANTIADPSSESVVTADSISVHIHQAAEEDKPSCR